MNIEKIWGLEVLDSRGNPTVKAFVKCGGVEFSAVAPSGASVGAKEAVELRDGGRRYFGKGVGKAVKNINEISKRICGMDCRNQQGIDKEMIDLDGTENKERLGANAIVSVSMACYRAGAFAMGIKTYEREGRIKMPIPYSNIINGGKHAENGLGIQEFMVFPEGINETDERVRAVSETYHTLKREMIRRYGKSSANVGDEGGFAPNLKKSSEALEILSESIEEAGYGGSVQIALDCAANSYYKDGRYNLDGKIMTAEELEDHYIELAETYKIRSIEDPFEENDIGSFSRFRKRFNGTVVSDDLTVSNPKIAKDAADAGAMDCLLLKVNQIGTVSEALETERICREKGISIMVSHRSGESEDSFISDFAVGIGCGRIKIGAPARGERTAKYNRLLEIWNEISNKDR